MQRGGRVDWRAGRRASDGRSRARASVCVHAHNAGRRVGRSVGVPVGIAVGGCDTGRSVGGMEGLGVSVGKADGLRVGETVGAVDGEVVGVCVGGSVGKIDGCCEGSAVMTWLRTRGGAPRIVGGNEGMAPWIDLCRHVCRH